MSKINIPIDSLANLSYPQIIRKCWLDPNSKSFLDPSLIVKKDGMYILCYTKMLTVVLDSNGLTIVIFGGKMHSYSIDNSDVRHIRDYIYSLNI